MNGLRFSMHNDTEAVRIELAGSLTGADVETVYQAWQSAVSTEPFRPVILDITSVTEADKRGQALLVIINRFGGEIVANSPESSKIALSLLAEPIKAASRVGWLGRLIQFFLNGRHTEPAFPSQAEVLRSTFIRDRFTPAF
ncbi:MAG TPA: hypothetical protein VMH05_08540 [Bryobacteraceae bacterium]|nr:hypothetical protein [Bryobacteraceae bacterium]